MSRPEPINMEILDQLHAAGWSIADQVPKQADASQPSTSGEG